MIAVTYVWKNGQRLLSLTKVLELTAGLFPLGGNRFQVGEEATPETVRFLDVIDGRATRATWSGHPFFRQ